LKLADFAAHAHAILLHCTQVRSARDQRDVFAGAREHRTEKSSDCACADDRESHNYCLEFRLQAVCIMWSKTA
jgi:hypothetical protein